MEEVGLQLLAVLSSSAVSCAARQLTALHVAVPSPPHIGGQGNPHAAIQAAASASPASTASREGKWSDDEHALYSPARCGANNWAAISAEIQGRTTAQVRTHARSLGKKEKAGGGAVMAVAARRDSHLPS